MDFASITDRMPAILQPDDWAAWLGETDASPADVKAVLSAVAEYEAAA